MKVFEKRSLMPGTVQDLFDFHAHPRALNRLTMPPLIMQTVRDDRASLTEGDLVFRMWFGPLPVTWHARHQPGPTPASFKDVMVRGPLAYWEHEHIFEDAGDGRAILIDRVRFAHKPGPPGWLTRLMFDGLPLRILFAYRHWRTRRGVRNA